MGKVIKRIGRWFEFNGRILAIVLVIMAVVSVGVWHASQPEEIAQDDFGDTTISDVAHEVSNLGYADGMQLLASGDEAKGRAVMQRLAPLNQGSKVAKGNAKAHLWMAIDLLREKKTGFLGGFPVAAAGGKKLSPPMSLDDDTLTARVQRHLESAEALDPTLDKAMILLAELHLAKGQRNEAIEGLFSSLATAEGANLNLAVYLANALAYKGDELGLEESVWHAFATLGQEVTSKKRSDINARVEYLLDAMVLKQFDLAEIGIGKFERDFSESENGAKLVSSLRASFAYMQAVALLGNDEVDLVKVTDFLIAAHSNQPGRLELVAALKTMVAHDSSLKAQVQAGLGAVSKVLEAEAPTEAAAMHLFLAELAPEKAQYYIERAQQLTPENAELVALWVDYQLNEQSVDYPELLKAIATASKQTNLNQHERYMLHFSNGKILAASSQWQAALESLEQALAVQDDTQSKKSKELHKLLGECYKSLGLEIIADEHLLLAAE